MLSRRHGNHPWSCVNEMSSLLQQTLDMGWIYRVDPTPVSIARNEKLRLPALWLRV